MNNYKWFVYDFQVNPSADGLEDVVVKVHWRRQVFAEPNGVAYAYETKGETDMPIPSSTNFIVFEDLTEDTVITWLEANIDMTALNAQLDTELDKLINPEFPFKTIPWDLTI